MVYSSVFSYQLSVISYQEFGSAKKAQNQHPTLTAIKLSNKTPTKSINNEARQRAPY